MLLNAVCIKKNCSFAQTIKLRPMIKVTIMICVCKNGPTIRNARTMEGLENKPTGEDKCDLNERAFMPPLCALGESVRTIPLQHLLSIFSKAFFAEQAR